MDGGAGQGGGGGVRAPPPPGIERVEYIIEREVQYPPIYLT